MAVHQPVLELQPVQTQTQNRSSPFMNRAFVQNQAQPNNKDRVEGIERDLAEFRQILIPLVRHLVAEEERAEIQRANIARNTARGAQNARRARNVGLEGLRQHEIALSEIREVRTLAQEAVTIGRLTLIRTDQILGITSSIQNTVGRIEGSVNRLRTLWRSGNRVGFMRAWVQNEFLMTMTFFMLHPAFPVSIEAITSAYIASMMFVRVGTRTADLLRGDVRLNIGGAMYLASPFLYLRFYWLLNHRFMRLRGAHPAGEPDPATNAAYRGNFESVMRANILALPTYVQTIGRTPFRVQSLPDLRNVHRNLLIFFRSIWNEELVPLLTQIWGTPVAATDFVLEFLLGKATIIYEGLRYNVESTLGTGYIGALLHDLSQLGPSAGALYADMILRLYGSVMSLVKQILEPCLRPLFGPVYDILGNLYGPSSLTSAASAASAALSSAAATTYDRLSEGAILLKQTASKMWGKKLKTDGGRLSKRKTRKHHGGSTGQRQFEINLGSLQVYTLYLEFCKLRYPEMMLQPLIDTLYELSAATYQLTLESSLGFHPTQPIMPMIQYESTRLIPYEDLVFFVEKEKDD